MPAAVIVPSPTVTQMVTDYHGGATILEVADVHGYLYGTTGRTLLEAGVILRQRGGWPGDRVYHGDPDNHRRACRA